MRVEDAVRTGLRLPVARSGIVAVYVLGFAALMAARAPMIVGGGLAAVVLSHQGRLTPLLDELQALDANDLQAGEPIPPGLEDALAGLFTPAAVGIVASALTATVLVAVVAQAVASAASMHAIVAALGDDDADAASGNPPGDDADAESAWETNPDAHDDGRISATSARGDDTVLAAVRGLRADARTFVGLVLARGFAALGIPALAIGLSGFLPSLAGSLLLLVAVPGGPLLYFALGFADQAAVVDDHGAVDALRASLGFVRANGGTFVGYLGVGATFLAALAVLGMVLSAVGLAALASPVVLIAAPLVFDGFKTALYADRGAPAPRVARGASDAGSAGDVPGAGATSGVGDRTLGALRDGVVTLGRFARGHVLANVAAAGLLLAGGLAGWFVTSQFGVELLAPGTGAGEVSLDPALAVGIWINNWLVAASTGIGGFAVGVPTVTNMLFNGLVIGAIAGVTNPVGFVALVAPHGVIELPAIAVAGGLGLVLGARAWAGLRGRRSDAALADDVREGFSVVLGLGVVLLVAALIEGFVTPVIGNAVL